MNHFTQVAVSTFRNRLALRPLVSQTRTLHGVMSSGRGRARGSRRGGFGRSDLKSVPSIRQVVPGAAVSIVLKQDQPTGREVQGVVQDVLTSGDHPRGIKVRMSDGRVGRVQRMQSRIADAPQSAASPATFQVISEGSTQPGTTQRMKYRDVRLDDEPEAPPATLDLAAYIKPAKQKKKGGKPTMQPSVLPTEEILGNSPPSTEASCPVCQEFKGDEAAVAHHVGEHFT